MTLFPGAIDTDGRDLLFVHDLNELEFIDQRQYYLPDDAPQSTRGS